MMCTNQSSNGQQSASNQCPEPRTNDEKKTNAFAAYEKAIAGYQFQVGRYNIWMNYYAIFVGALFVALYSIWPKSEIETLCCACKPVCGKAPAAVAESQEWFLPLIISVLGWIASLCWYGALLGYRKWNEHWVGVVQKIEKIIIGEKPQTTNEDLKVYLDLPKSSSEDVTPRYIKGFISTQKTTGSFIFFVALAWGGVLFFILSNWCCGETCYWLVAGASLTVIAICLLRYGRFGLYSSTIIDR